MQEESTEKNVELVRRILAVLGGRLPSLAAVPAAGPGSVLAALLAAVPAAAASPPSFPPYCHRLPHYRRRLSVQEYDISPTLFLWAVAFFHWL